jgi:hypothetical protein
MPFYYYLAAGSGCVAVLAIILYFAPGGRIRVPAIVFCALACLVAGIGLGVITMYRFGYHWEREPQGKVLRSNMGGGGGPPDGGGARKGGEGGGKKGEGKNSEGQKGEGKSSDGKDTKNGDAKNGEGKKAGSPDSKNGAENKTKSVND